MSLIPAYPATLLQHDPPLHPRALHPRYTCATVADNDCGNGYCCGAADKCVTQDGAAYCKLPGAASTLTTATLASDATASATSANSGASVTACSGSGTDCVVVANGASSSSSSSSTGLSTGAIVGIVVGIVAVLAIVVGAVVFFLCARKRRRRREAANAGMAGTGAKDTAYVGAQGPPGYQPVAGDNGGMVDMYAGSNVGKMQEGVPGRVEMMGDTQPVMELPGNEGVRPVELDAGPTAEKKTGY